MPSLLCPDCGELNCTCPDDIPDKLRDQYDRELIAWANRHNWDSLEPQKDLILRHLRTFAGDVGLSESHDVEEFYRPDGIYICELSESDVGAWVEYDAPYADVEKGRIKSWTEKHVFVVFHCAGEWDNFADYTAKACEPSRLFRTEEPDADTEA